MTKKTLRRIVSLVLVLILSVSVLPLPAHAGIRDLVQQYASISGSWGDTKFWRNNRYTYPFEFDEELTSCTGFTLDFEVVEVNAGNVSSGDFKWEVYVRKSNGSWKSVETFYMDGLSTTVDVEFEPLTIDAVAVICGKKTYVDYVQELTVRGAKYQSSSSNSSSNSSSSSSSTYSSGTKVSGSWSDTQFWRSNRSAYPFEFYSPIRSCRGFTLNYQVTEVTSGNLNGNFKYAVYIHTTSGKWKYIDDFTMDGYSIVRKVTWDDPMGIDAVAVLCLKGGNYTYSYNFTITDPITG